MMRNRVQTPPSLKNGGWRGTTAKGLKSLIKMVADGSNPESAQTDSGEMANDDMLGEQISETLDVYQLYHQKVEMNAALRSVIPFGMPRSRS
jgi:hypothetical protein